MKQVSNINRLIIELAPKINRELKKLSNIAEKEEDLRIGVEKILLKVQDKIGIQLEGKHEYTIGKGRVDSVYGSVIIEYKKPGTLSSKRDSTGNKRVIVQLKKRFLAFQKHEKRKMKELFGVGCDGYYFIFLKFQNGKWIERDPVPLTDYTVSRYLWALFSLGTGKSKPFTANELTLSFGAKSNIAKNGIKTLYFTLINNPTPKSETFFKHWKILFGQVCGYEFSLRDEIIRELVNVYDLNGIKDINSARILFSIHTYYSLLMKLIVSEITNFYHHSPEKSPFQKILGARDENQLKAELESLEKGVLFQDMGVTNYLEGDLFSWYLSSWNDDIKITILEMVAELTKFNPGTFSDDPFESRDLLKNLYQNLFPRSVRHDLGEYYTPDWLAEHLIDQLKYNGNPDIRILDPACGSGTFLVMIINRIRQWFESHRKGTPNEERDLLNKILSNVIGFDLNPIAVLTARTNFLLAINEWMPFVDEIELPIYLCDSILAPTIKYYIEFVREGYEIKTAAGNFSIPLNLTTDRSRLVKYTNILEFTIRNEYSFIDFVNLCMNNNIPIENESQFKKMYQQLQSLHEKGMDEIWPRIIKNAFAPNFIKKIDIIVGNPPWIRWGYLPRDYRDKTKELWMNYGLFPSKGFEARMGSGEKDLSMLFTYVCIDRYLKDQGKLGFVITQVVFKSKKQGKGFRRFQIKHDQKFKVLRADDMVELRPFKGVANRTTTFIAKKGEQMFYPVQYTLWRKIKGKNWDSESSLSFVKDCTKRIPLYAQPVGKDPTNPWLTAKKDELPIFTRIQGPSAYKALYGMRIEPHGVFKIKILKHGKKNTILVENCHDIGKTKDIPKIDATIEKDLVFPIIGGKNIGKWLIKSYEYAIVPQDANKRIGYPEEFLKKNYKLTYSFLKNFEEILRGRKSRSAKMSFAKGGPFYSLYDLIPDTLAPYKVVWPRMGKELRCAVIKSVKDEFLGKKLVLPIDNITFIRCQNENEAYFLCGVLNSALVEQSLKTFSGAGRGFAVPSILKNLSIPKFQPYDNLHEEIVSLSRDIESLIRSKNKPKLKKTLNQLETKVWELFGIADEEIKILK